jgi:type IX secretion system PorP/SprF family membrane protein
MMKYFLVGVSCFGMATLYGQQRPHYTQYVLNNFIINPAIAGIENYTDVKLSHRHQWVGIRDAPVTTYATIHGRIGKKGDWFGETNPTSFTPTGKNPRGEAYWQQYTAPEPHHGWGVTMINDRTGPLTRFSCYGTYAYHTNLNSRTNISAGIGFGFTNNTLNTTKLLFDNPIDPAVATSNLINTFRPDINAGIWLYNADYFAGISVFQIINQGFRFSVDTLKTSVGNHPHLFFTAGYKLYSGPDFTLLPHAVVRLVDGLPLGIDALLKAQYRDLLWIGGGYRLNDGFMGMVGINVNSAFNIGYSYDYTISPLRTFTQGTHEIVLGFLIGNKYGDLCPRNIW